ncbi:sulfotransferase [Oceaniglobus ichthyenteri]|uniref:sulfotransferase n=1 Tax=Oceaniglobus ichthyenteri TaxID=2136177 RepID=UPI0013DDB4AA|nr:sulfotransferase [Oceaniglobus ichthyenteri]
MGKGKKTARDTVLMFCVGATKSGTSWLHEALVDHPACHLRTVKELHYFDALEKGKFEPHIREITLWRDKLAARVADAKGAKKADLSRRIKDRDDWLQVLNGGGENPGAYMDYLTHGQGAAHVIGDVTPAYGLLPVARLRAMAELTDDVRFIYLMRDPVARLWSHVRMIATRRSETGILDPNKARNILMRTIAGDEREIEIRGDYAGALTRLHDAVPEGKLLTIFYEDLFGGDGMTRICDFLDLAAISGVQTRRVHEGATLDMPERLRDKAQEWLAPQYDHVAHRLGRLPEAWQANRVKV